MRLSERLETIMCAAGCGTAAADVGTDHALVPIELVRRGAYEKVIAMDLRKDPLRGAAEHVREAGLEEKIELRLGDGLSALAAGEAETVLISGMGGPLMEKILTEGREKALAAKKLVLSPQSDIPAFRRFLQENGFGITDEAMVREDGKYYTVLTVQPGQQALWNETELCYGRCLMQARDPVMLEMARRDVRVYLGILKALENADGEAAEMRRAEVRRRLEAARNAGQLPPSPTNLSRGAAKHYFFS